LLEPIRHKRERYTAYVERALADMRRSIKALGDPYFVNTSLSLSLEMRL